MSAPGADVAAAVVLVGWERVAPGGLGGSAASLDRRAWLNGWQPALWAAAAAAGELSSGCRAAERAALCWAAKGDVLRAGVRVGR